MWWRHNDKNVINPHNDKNVINPHNDKNVVHSAAGWNFCHTDGSLATNESIAGGRHITMAVQRGDTKVRG